MDRNSELGGSKMRNKPPFALVLTVLVACVIGLLNIGPITDACKSFLHQYIQGIITHFQEFARSQIGK